MIINDNQIRHVYNCTDPNKAKSRTKNGKFFMLITDEERFPGQTDEYRTDLIETKQIRSVVVSKPIGLSKKSIKFPIDTTTAVGDVYHVDFDFEDWYGIGRDHFYHKFIEVVAKSTTLQNVANLIKNAIELTFKHEAYNPFTITVLSSSISGTYDVVITEKEQYHNPELGIDKTTLNWNIGVKFYDKSADTTYVYKDDDGTYAAQTYNVTKTYIKNMYLLNDLLYAANKNRADLYGYLGFPNVNPSKVNLLTTATNYVVVDIVYVKEGSGSDIQEQRKEMTLIIDPEDSDTSLLKIIKRLFGGVSDWSGVLFNNESSVGYCEEKAISEITTSEVAGSLGNLKVGCYWKANL